ncbi:MAG: magnesium transporter [Myxococcota bacterium]
MSVAPQGDLAALIAPDVEEMLRSQPQDVPAALEEFHAADIAEIAQRLSTENRALLLQTLPPDQAAGVLEYLDKTTTAETIQELEPAAAGALLGEMAADDRADLVASLPEEVAAPVLAQVAPQERQEVQKLLSYEPNTAGGLMTPEFVRLSPDVTVGEAIVRIRKGAHDKETVYAAYVTDNGNKLLGVASLRDLLASPDNLVLRDVMTERVVSVKVNTDQEEVAQIMGRYDLLAVPVLDDSGAILGIVTVDDVMDVLVQEGTEDVQRMGAVAPIDVPYFKSGVMDVLRARAGWLSVIFLGEMFTGTVLKEFEDELARAMSLVVFIPLIISSGGNAGSQSSTVITRSLAVGEVKLDDFKKVFNREFAAGMGLGAILGLIGVARAGLWGFGGDIMATVGLTLMGVVALGTVLGAVLPMGLKRVGLDPALTSAPFIASLIDVGGILLYLMVARLVMF